MNYLNRHIELLAPAGNFDALQAAVCAGANAVYLGLEHFNARRGADNFTLENLQEACDYAHFRGVKIYLTLNIIVFENEFNDAMQLAYGAADAGVDAFIVQDLGLAKTIAEEIPNVALHISTQMNIHDEDGFMAVAKLGAKRVTLGRECSLAQIKKICETAKSLNVEIETFAHGALCICLSGQCLMSSMIGGRSANRGTCAQACRLNYQLNEGQASLGKKRYNEDEKRGQFLLSPKDLCTIEILPKLIDAGVSSLKIEGRMKSANYVYEVVSVYRQALDLFKNEGPDKYKIEDSQKKRLEQAFSRGFTTAYLEGNRGNEIMSYKRPNNRGVNIGRVSNISRNKIAIGTKERVCEGDVLEIWTKRGRSTLKVDKNAKIYDSKVEFLVNSNDFAVKNIKKNDRAFRVKSTKVNFVSNKLYPKVNVSCSVSLMLDKPAKIMFSTEDYSICFEGDIVERAKTKSVTKDEVKNHIDRLGQTPFQITDFKIELDDGVGIAFSQLHHLRSKALDALYKKMLNTNNAKLGQRQPKKTIKKNKTKKTIGIYMSDDVFASDLFCDTLGKFYKNLSNAKSIEIGPHIPVVNVESVYYFKNAGVKRIWLSPELSLEQIANITRRFPEMSFGIYAMGLQELMITRHCVLMSQGQCDQKCKNCQRRSKNHYLLDRKGYEFPVKTDVNGYSHIYNSVSLDLSHCVEQLIGAGIDAFLIDTTNMSSTQAKDCKLRLEKSLTTKVEKSANTTTGHIFRTVL